MTDPPDVRRTRVLVVDDDADMRAMLGDVLAYLGCEVVQAGDGRAALAVLEAESVDLVLTDLAMPELSGAGLVAALARMPSRPLVFLLTGEPRSSGRPGLPTEGFDGWLEKPVRLDELAALLKRRPG